MSVTVVIPFYKSHDTLPRCLESVASQSHLPDRVLVCDDDTPDSGPEAIVQDFAHRLSIDVVTTAENIGPGGARNLGWQHSKTEMVAFLDADDAWAPGKLAAQLGWMRKHPQFTITAHRCVTFSDGAAPASFSGRELKPTSLLFHNPIATSSVVVRRDFQWRFPERRHSEDYGFWLKAGLSRVPIALAPEALAWRFKSVYGDSGASAAMWSMTLGELHNFAELRAEGLLSGPTSRLAQAVSVLKYARRRFRAG